MSTNTLAKIREKLAERPARLEMARRDGRKVIGYYCCNIPEELLLALDLIPLRLGQGGDDRLVEIGSRYISPQTCAFVRENVGLFAAGTDPYLKHLDGLAVAANCLQIYRLAEVVDYYFQVKTMVIGVPRNFYQEDGIHYFEEVIADFVSQLEELARAKLDPKRLADSIRLYREIRGTVLEIYQLLTNPDSGVAWREVYELVQAGFFLDRVEYLALLQEFLAEKQAPSARGAGTSRARNPRLLLSGSLIATGDQKLLNIITEVGGEVVVDDLCTGLRPFLGLNITESSPAGIARAYLERVPCGSLPRLDLDGDQRLRNLAELIRTYRPDGVIYHTLRNCDPFTFKANETKRFLGSEVPFLEIHTEYASSDTEGIRTRVGAFVELIRALRKDKEAEKVG